MNHDSGSSPIVAWAIGCFGLEYTEEPVSGSPDQSPGMSSPCRGWKASSTAFEPLAVYPGGAGTDDTALHTKGCAVRLPEVIG